MKYFYFLFLDFINSGNVRSVLVKKNIAASILIKGFSVLINLLLVSITIKYINPQEYGIWLTLSSIIAWFTFFDIGFGHGLRNKFTESKAMENHQKARNYVSTTYAIILILFFTLWVIFCCVNFFLDWTNILNTSFEMFDKLQIVVFVIFTFFCIQMVLKTISTLLIADQQPAKSAFFDTLSQLFVLILIYFLSRNTQGSLLNLAIITGVIPVFVLIVSSIYFYSNEFKYYRPSLKYIKFSLFKDVFNLGSKFFLIQIAVIIIYQTNNIIIARNVSLEDVTIFNIAYKYMSLALLLFTIILTPVWSAFTDASSTNDYAWMKSALQKLRIISLFLILLLILLLSLADVFYEIWIGDQIIIPFKVSLTVAIYVLALIVVGLHTQILNGLGKVKIQLLTYSLATIFHIPLATELCNIYGLVGVLYSSIFFYSIISFFTVIQVNKLVSNKARGIWLK